ncbi:hypothetical protein Dimus_016404 [Dionaea muscipula]
MGFFFFEVACPNCEVGAAARLDVPLPAIFRCSLQASGARRLPRLAWGRGWSLHASGARRSPSLAWGRSCSPKPTARDRAAARRSLLLTMEMQLLARSLATCRRLHISLHEEGGRPHDARSNRSVAAHIHIQEGLCPYVVFQLLAGRIADPSANLPLLRRRNHLSDAGNLPRRNHLSDAGNLPLSPRSISPSSITQKTKAIKPKIVLSLSTYSVSQAGDPSPRLAFVVEIISPSRVLLFGFVRFSTATVNQFEQFVCSTVSEYGLVER